MDMNKKQLEFFTVLLGIILAASVLILLVDFGIKASILEESTRLRLKIEEWQNGRSGTQANTSRVGNDFADDASISIPVLVDQPTGMETANVPNGVAETSTNSRARRRPKPKGQANDSGIPNGNESVG